jgi:hypothetical protein
MLLSKVNTDGIKNVNPNFAPNTIHPGKDRRPIESIVHYPC